MLLFSRIITPMGNPRRVMPWVAEMTKYVNDNSDLAVTCWAGNFGYPVGTVAWSSLLESQSALAAATATLMGQAGYLDLIEAAADFVQTPGQDLLREIIHGEPGVPLPLGAVATITTATAVVDRMADAVGWAVEIAQHVEQVMGYPVSVLTDVFGVMGGVTWIGGVPDIAAADSGRAKLAADTGYLAKLAGSKGLFMPGSGRVGQLTRIA